MYDAAGSTTPSRNFNTRINAKYLLGQENQQTMPYRLLIQVTVMTHYYVLLLNFTDLEAI